MKIRISMIILICSEILCQDNTIKFTEVTKIMYISYRVMGLYQELCLNLGIFDWFHILMSKYFIYYDMVA